MDNEHDNNIRSLGKSTLIAIVVSVATAEHTHVVATEIRLKCDRVEIKNLKSANDPALYLD